ncbi:MAG TPA: hypothetical protein VFO74_01990 [Pseudolabrys sp.]|nr:hypothetical protein [Pseudolabrys sp.]
MRRRSDPDPRRPEAVEREGERVTRYPGRCKGCGRNIWWIRFSGRMLPEDDDGRDHRETCTERVQFRRVQQEELFR